MKPNPQIPTKITKIQGFAVQAAMGAWEARGAREKLEHVRYNGGHALTPDRTEKIISWMTEQTNR